MGIQSQAFLVYGIDLGSSMPPKLNPNNESFVDLDDVLCADLVEPSYSSPDYAQYAAKRKAILASCPVELCVYGRDDEHRYILMLRDHDVSAHNETPTRFNANILTVPDEKLAAFMAFCKAYEVNRGNPCWLLVAR